MSFRRCRFGKEAFTLIELLVVLAIIVILVAVFFHPSHEGKNKARSTACLYNLKKLGESFIAWSKNHDAGFPMQVSVTNGGSMELIESGSAIAHFQTLTNSGLIFPGQVSELISTNGKHVYASRSTTNYGLLREFLACPSDKRRASILLKQSIAEITDSNISYFIGLDARTANGASVLAGDRHLELNGKVANPGLITFQSDASIKWSKELHSSFGKGSLLFADGHVEFVKRPIESFQRQIDSGNRLAVP